MLYLQRHDIQLRTFPEGRFLHELVSVEQAKEIIEGAVSKSAAWTPFALIPGGVVLHIPALAPVVPEPAEGLRQLDSRVTFLLACLTQTSFLLRAQSLQATSSTLPGGRRYDK